MNSVFPIQSIDDLQIDKFVDHMLIAFSNEVDELKSSLFSTVGVKSGEFGPYNNTLDIIRRPMLFLNCDPPLKTQPTCDISLIFRLGFFHSRKLFLSL